MYEIRIVSSDGRTLARAHGESEANLYYRSEYAPGDAALFTCDSRHALVKVDACVERARVYLPGGSFAYRFPIEGDNLRAYAPGAFKGSAHLLSISGAFDNERRDLALNPIDQRWDSGAYPHASANVETRGESVFCARNVIDGVTIADGHGDWPYESWGIGAREDAFLDLDFGREVVIDEVVLYLRADFPHDAYWTSADMEFDGENAVTMPLVGVDGPQRVKIEPRAARKIRLTRLKKCDMPSAFPSLKQLKVFGRDARA